MVVQLMHPCEFSMAQSLYFALEFSAVLTRCTVRSSIELNMRPAAGEIIFAICWHGLVAPYTAVSFAYYSLHFYILQTIIGAWIGNKIKKMAPSHIYSFLLFWL